jgi:hypothetical protein
LDLNLTQPDPGVKPSFQKESTVEFADVVWEDESLASLLPQVVSGDGLALLPPAQELEANVLALEGWLRAGFEKLATAPIHLISIGLGDAPDHLSMEGYRLLSGQSSADAVLDQVSQDEWDWMDDDEIVDFDEVVEMAYHPVGELPYPPHDFEAEDDPGDGDGVTSLSYEDREGVWGVMVLASLRRLVREEQAATWLAHGQRAVPLFVGYEVAPELVGVLTDRGFYRPFS